VVGIPRHDAGGRGILLEQVRSDLALKVRRRDPGRGLAFKIGRQLLEPALLLLGLLVPVQVLSGKILSM
jgi:hypothetical protein